MTKAFVEANQITVLGLEGLKPGGELGPFSSRCLFPRPHFREGSLVIRKGDSGRISFEFSDRGDQGFQTMDPPGFTAREAYMELLTEDYQVA